MRFCKYSLCCCFYSSSAFVIAYPYLTSVFYHSFLSSLHFFLSLVYFSTYCSLSFFLSYLLFLHLYFVLKLFSPSFISVQCILVTIFPPFFISLSLFSLLFPILFIAGEYVYFVFPRSRLEHWQNSIILPNGHPNWIVALLPAILKNIFRGFFSLSCKRPDSTSK